jgi:hypothetical protein
MEHCTDFQSASVKDNTFPIHHEEFDVLITGSQIIFSWNSKDISEIARALGEPEIDLGHCG